MGSKVRPLVQAIVIQHYVLIDKYKFMGGGLLRLIAVVAVR